MATAMAKAKAKAIAMKTYFTKNLLQNVLKDGFINP